MSRSLFLMSRALFLFILFASSQPLAMASCDTDRLGVVICGRGDCAQDKAGNVFCSKYLFGGARTDEYGKVVCGKGQCVPSVKFKDFYCSAVESGGADVDRFGVVKCYGGCEQASELMCENEKGR
jgi:hypothetical protein